MLKDRDKFIHHLRTFLGISGAILVWLFAHPNETTFRIGTFIVLLGAGLRFWAAGYLHKRRELATDGPYAYTRNPLYLGTFIIVAGLMIVGNLLYFVPFTLALMYFIYRRIIISEEQTLLRIFGSQYEEYRKQVPCILPRLRPATPSLLWKGFSPERAFENKEHFHFLIAILYEILLYTKEEMFIEKEGFEPKNVLVLTLFVFLSCVLARYMHDRAMRKRQVR